MKNHHGRTYFDEYMLTCLRGAVFLRHSVCMIMINTLHMILANKLLQPSLNSSQIPIVSGLTQNKANNIVDLILQHYETCTKYQRIYQECD